MDNQSNIWTESVENRIEYTKSLKFTADRVNNPLRIPLQSHQASNFFWNFVSELKNRTKIGYWDFLLEILLMV